MKQLLLLAALLLPLLSYSQQDNYSDKWQKIEFLEARGLVESADSLVTEVLASAKKRKEHVQVIKAKIFHYKFYQINNEESNQYILDDINSTINYLPVPYKNVMLSYKAMMLEQYFLDNRWRSRGRNKTDDPDPGSIEAWDLKTVQDSIYAAYNKSLQNEKVLIATRAGDIEPLLFSNHLNRKYRPTLYDVLAHKALTYYSNTSNFTSVNAEEEYELNTPDLFSATPRFIKFNFPVNARQTSKVQILKTWQKLEALHSAEKNTEALVYAHLSRLEYVNARYTGEDTWDLYVKALEDLAAQYESKEVQALILLDLAMTYYNRATETDEDGKLLNPDFYTRALNMAGKITRDFPNTDTAQKAYNLISSITNVQLYAKVPGILAQNEPGRMHLSYKSLDTLQLRIFKVDHGFDDKITWRNKDSIILGFLNKENLLEQQIALPLAIDHNTHSTEILLPRLEKGNYLVIAAGKDPKEGYAYGFMQVTNLSLSRTDFDKYTVYRALHRISGEAVSNVKVEFKFNRGASLVRNTNETGEFIYQKSRNRDGSKGVLVSKDGDTLSTHYWPGYYNSTANDQDDEPRAKTLLYLDRAIYRPGQKVYFKGVLLQHIKKKTSTVADTWVEVFVEDPNGEEIQSFRLKTNKYGSFTGEFSLPSTGITGEFEIYAEEDTEEDSHFWDKIMENGDYDDYGSKLSFSVEEYKRPTFEVKFDEIRESFKPGDTAVVMGTAKSFMGAGINNTNLIYEITRQKLVKRWWYFNFSDPVMLVKDTIITDAEGNFRIAFAALATAKDLEDENLLYQYTIKAIVTDASGETREAVTTLKIGHKNLLTTLSLPETVQAGENLKIEIENTNLNGSPVPVTGKIWIYKLQGPGRILGNRMWEAPEINLIPEEEFIALFPEEPYGKNLPPEDWPEGQLVYEGELQNDGTAEIIVAVTGDWQSGQYLVKTESSNADNSASAKKAFEVVNPEDQYLADHQRFSYSIQNKDFEKDGKVEVLLQTAYKDLKLEVAAYDGYVQLFKKQVEVNGRELINIPLKELKGKELDLQIRGVKNNSLISETHRIRLPQASRSLNIETGTFRNKIQPGMDETWSFTIKDEKNAVPDAEVLASMYDASLDQFITSDWITNPGFGDTYKQFPSFSNSNIRNITTLMGNFPHRDYRAVNRIFDRFELFGFYFSRPNSYQYKNYLNTLKKPEISKALSGNTRGIVTGEDGLPLPAVVIIIKGTQTGTQTNVNGEFALDTRKGDVLVFSYVGYSTYEMKVEDKKEIFVVLEVDSASLDEVVVVGYGVEEEAMEDMERAQPPPAREVAMMLQGKVAGISVSDDIEGSIRIRGNSSITDSVSLFIVDGKPVTSHNLRPEDILSVEILEGEEALALYGASGSNGVVIITTRQGMDALQNVQARKNLDETAFFLPNITVDKNGRLQFSFTSPEALTRWKLRLLAHTKDWITGKYEASVQTQKELSVMPNPPRFLREGDSITFKARVTNLSAEALSGTAILQLYNAVTMEPIDDELGNSANTRNFNITASNTEAVSWKLSIPKGIPAVTYRILARSGDFSDGEENMLPVLTNRMLVKESLPVFVRAGQTKTYEFTNLKDNVSGTLDHHQFSLEYSSNPAWYAIQSLPYLIEFEHECSEQTFARLYANSVAGHIINSQPKIKEVFEAWHQSDALVSDLEKNEELRSVILAETPWVRDAASETEKKQRLAQLFDTVKLETEKAELIKRLEMMQNSSGAWPWFSGGRDNNFITRHIVGGLGHLKKLNIEVRDGEIIKKAIAYLDRQIVERERRSKQYDSNQEYFYKNVSHLHYLYVRSFYLEEYPLPANVQKIADKVLTAQKEDWHLRNLYDKGLLSMVLMKLGEKQKAAEILEALKESAVKSEEYGMYWKENISGWYWYRAPVETQALLIEAYTEMGSDETTVEELKIWLLQNKRTNHWPTTIATTEATYALLMQGGDWLQIGDNTQIKLGGNPLPAQKLAETEKEAGTGYLKVNWKGEEIESSFSKIEVENRNTTAGYGGVYWQYFEDLDKIKVHSESPLNVEKELYLNVTDRNGKSLKRITTETPLRIGDLVTVRLVVRSTADMDYIHLKDMRASGFEPTNVLSTYKYQDGTAYYESTRDAATHFFFDSLNKGTYVLEYTVRANNAGNFSNGITNIESMYAPEFSGHTKGIRVEIKE